jgi:uncharacterized protein
MVKEAESLPNKTLERRSFLRTMGGLGAAMPLIARAGNNDSTAKRPEDIYTPPGDANGAIPQRPFGRTGVTLPVLGMGGHHLGDAKSVDEAVNLVHEAIDSGIRFFDNCWEYYNGRSEDWLGRGLKGKRSEVFLMTKVCTHGRDGQLGIQMLEQSLRRLQTDHLDLWQVHGVTFDNDPELAYRKGGIIEALDRAKQQGKVRFTGFTGHKDPALHLKMIEMGYGFDAVQMPLNAFDHSFLSFEALVLPVLNRKGIAALGMKSMGGSADGIKQGLVTAEELLAYAMSLPVAVTISGMDSQEVLHQNLRIARGLTPMTESQMQAVRAKCAAAAADGRYELYKVSIRYDNPQARQVHSFPDDPTEKEMKETQQQIMGSGVPH